MIDVLLNGVPDSSEKGLRAILRAQTKLRIAMALPFALIGVLLFFQSADGVPLVFIGLTLCYCAYAGSIFVATRTRSSRVLKNLLVATAVLDPIVLSICIVMSGQVGILLAGIYLFTTLGFGFRTSRALMHLCQVTSIAGFIAVFICDPFWNERPIIWAAILVPIILVPLYAGTLISKLASARLVADEARAQAVSESRGKSELLAKVSHELRTPLTGIVTATELLEDEFPDARVVRRTDTIRRLADSLLLEINDLLDQAKYDAQGGAISVARVDLQDRLCQLARSFEMMAARKGIEFRLAIDPLIADEVETDPHLIERVITNLVANAIKFTNVGHVEFAVNLMHETSANYRLYFHVTDTGIGIPDSFRDKIFDAFAQVETGSERKYGGTGLGLSLSKRMVDLLGGDLQYVSTLGRGSRFSFELTVPRLGRLDEVANTPEQAANHPTRKRILVAEDNQTNMMLLKELLEIDEHVVTTASSGIEALELLAKQTFDVLLLDYNLGDMDGVRVLQTYRFGRTRTSPVIFLTADATPQTAKRLYEAGSAAILYKPVTLSLMRAALQNVESLVTSDGDRPVESAPEPVTARADRPALKLVPVNALDKDALEALKEIGPRPEFVTEMLISAQADIAQACGLLLDTLAGKSHISLRDTAHTLKGVCLTIGAHRLAAVAANLMRLSIDELDRSSDRFAADLRDAHQMTIAAIHKAIGEVSSGSVSNRSALHLD